MSRQKIDAAPGRLDLGPPVAVVDIGSNSVRLVVYEGLTRAPTPLFNEKALCGLGREVQTTGLLAADAVDLALASLKRYRALCTTVGVKKIYAIATAACRDAKNGRAFINLGERILEHKIDILRRMVAFCRTVPDIVFALLFVAAFGLGPLPGVLAIAIHTFGALGKLFTEVIENIDMKPVEGVRSTGATFLETVRFAAVPQVLSGFASYALLRFEINVRSGTVIGLVGAGGIGQDLFVAIRKFYYTDVSAILLMIIITVAAIDVVTGHIRQRLAGLEATR